MFQSRPGGRGPKDKINSVSSNIPSNSSINRETASPECVPLCLTYIRWSTPNLCASLGLNCRFKISTDSANSPSCITHCGSLAQTQYTVPSQLSVRFPLFSISFITVCFMYATIVSGLLVFLLACLTVCVSSSICLLLPKVISLFPSNWNLCIQHVYSAFDWNTEILNVPLIVASHTSSILKSHTDNATLPTFLHNKPTITVANPQFAFEYNSSRQLWGVHSSLKSITLCVK